MEAFLYHQDKYFTLDPVYDYISKSPIELSNAFSRFNSFESIHVEKSTSSTPQVSLEKKRKQSDDSCLSTGQSKGRKESTKSRRKESKAKDLNSTRNGEPPSGFIHVRARRGQATDSHSLAERVRRERISDRMKKLQELVPGCENVIGKALVLEEIINYVQSLQNQVEFLSMRLASVNPVVYDFGGAYEDYMGQREEMGSTSQSMPCVTQNSHIPPTAFEGATNRPQQVMDTAAVFTLYHEQGPPAFSQDGGSNIMQAGDQRRSIINQVELLKQHVLFPIEEKQMGASQNIWSCDQ